MTVRTTSLDAAGTLSVDGGNIFAILKESLYGESDIVFRELVANAADAIAKRAAERGAPGEVVVTVDPDARTITVADDGIGMDEDEVRRYINQIALSGTEQFVQDSQQPDAVTVGHFGVGFYSAFMLADTVEIQTRSARGADPVRWLGHSDMTWQIDAGDRAATGTSVILHLDADAPHLADPALARAAVERYFPFPHVTIRVRTPEGETVVGDVTPVWRRPASDVDDAEVRAFYRHHFGEQSDPLGWVRIDSADLGLRGMVFYRDTRGGAEALDGRVDVFSRGVQLDSVPAGAVPKFAALQHVVLECDQLALVVSRAQVRTAPGEQDVCALVAECLSQELAIAMHAMFTEERERFEQLWPELAPFVKYGVLTDRVFASVMTRRVVFPTLDGELVTLGEYLERVAASHPGTVFYTSDPVGQAQYASAFRSAGIPALVLDHVIDNAMLQRLEIVSKDIVFLRLDADVARVLAAEPAPQDDAVRERAAAVLAPIAERRLPAATVSCVTLRSPELAVMLTVDEVDRRIDELRRMNGLVTGRVAEAQSVPRTLLVNVTSPIVRGLAAADAPRAALVAEHLVDLALLAQDELTSDELLAFLARSEQLLASHLSAPVSQEEE